jgi:glycosyltransferase involved in cell wall biosynthesis
MAGQQQSDATPPVDSGLIVVVPCYNAGPGFASVIARIAGVASNVHIIDDGSTDGAVDDVHSDIASIVRFETNRGKGHSILEGFRLALDSQAGCVAILDADGQHDPAELPRLYSIFKREQADLLIGTRRFEQRNVPWVSWFGNKLTRTVTRLLLGRTISDTQSGYRLHSRRLMEAVVRDIPGGRYETEMLILVKAIREDYRIIAEPIQTLYERGNPTSHFRRIRDSWRVWRALFLASLSKSAS